MGPGVDEEYVHLNHPPSLPKALDEIDKGQAMFVHEGEVFVDRGRADVVFDEGTFEQDQRRVAKRIATPTQDI